MFSNFFKGTGEVVLVPCSDQYHFGLWPTFNEALSPLCQQQICFTYFPSVQLSISYIFSCYSMQIGVEMGV